MEGKICGKCKKLMKIFSDTREAFGLFPEREIIQLGIGAFLISIFVIAIFPFGQLTGISRLIAVMWLSGFYLSALSYCFGAGCLNTFYKRNETELVAIFGPDGFMKIGAFKVTKQVFFHSRSSNNLIEKRLSDPSSHKLLRVGRFWGFLNFASYIALSSVVHCKVLALMK
jgi:hypothetical protein